MREPAASDTWIADRTSAFLQNVLTSTSLDSPESVAGVRLLLDEASRRTREEVGDDNPDVKTTIRQTIGHAYLAIGDLDSAGDHLLAAWQDWRSRHGDGNKDSVCILTDFTKVWIGRGEYAKAEEAIRDTLPRAVEELGDDHEYIARLRASLDELRRLQAG